MQYAEECVVHNFDVRWLYLFLNLTLILLRSIPTARLVHKCYEPITGSRRIQLYIRPVTVKVVCTILSSPETLLQWAAPHLTLTPDFSNIRLSRPGGCIDHSGSLAERRRRSPHDQAGSGIRTRNLTITKPMINQLSYLAVKFEIKTNMQS